MRHAEADNLFEIDEIGHTTRIMEGSPYYWISDKLWRVWLRIYGPRDQASPNPIQQALIVEVSEDDRRRAPIWNIADASEQTPRDSVAELVEHLANTQGPGRVVGVQWPVCCNDLSTLIFHHGAGEDVDVLESEAGTLDRILLESYAAEQGCSVEDSLADWRDLLVKIRDKRHSGEGVDIFHCRFCGRLYGGFSEP